MKTHHKERRSSARIKLQASAAILTDQEYRVEESTLSISGGGVPIELPQEVGTPLQFQIPGVGTLLARIIRKTAGHSYLGFILNQEEKLRMTEFMNRYSREGRKIFPLPQRPETTPATAG